MNLSSPMPTVVSGIFCVEREGFRIDAKRENRPQSEERCPRSGKSERQQISPSTGTILRNRSPQITTRPMSQGARRKKNPDTIECRDSSIRPQRANAYGCCVRISANFCARRATTSGLSFATLIFSEGSTVRL